MHIVHYSGKVFKRPQNGTLYSNHYGWPCPSFLIIVVLLVLFNLWWHKFKIPVDIVSHVVSFIGVQICATRIVVDLKGIIHSKMKICCKCTHPQTIQDVNRLVSSLEQIWFRGIYHYITCSPMDLLQWMGAVRMIVKTADENITIMHC